MRFLIFILLLLPAACFAQTGNLTVFGDQLPFHLYINDILQNEKSNSNIRINNIPPNYFNLKIVFENGAYPAIIKKNIGLVDADNVTLDVIYKLKKEKDGKIKLHFYGNSPTGRSKPDSITTIITYTGSVEIVNTPAVRPVKNDSIQSKITESKKEIKTSTPVVEKKKEPMVSDAKTETKKAEIKPSIKPNSEKPETPAFLKKCTGWPVAKDDFDQAKHNVLSATTDELKLKEAKSLASANCLMVSQVSELVGLLNTEISRFSFIKFAYAFTIDRQNYSKLKSSLKELRNQAAVDELIKLR